MRALVYSWSRACDQSEALLQTMADDMDSIGQFLELVFPGAVYFGVCLLNKTNSTDPNKFIYIEKNY